MGGFCWWVISLVNGFCWWVGFVGGWVLLVGGFCWIGGFGWVVLFGVCLQVI